MDTQEKMLDLERQIQEQDDRQRDLNKKVQDFEGQVQLLAEEKAFFDEKVSPFGYSPFEPSFWAGTRQKRKSSLMRNYDKILVLELQCMSLVLGQAQERENQS